MPADGALFYRKAQNAWDQGYFELCSGDYFGLCIILQRIFFRRDVDVLFFGMNILYGVERGEYFMCGVRKNQ